MAALNKSRVPIRSVRKGRDESETLVGKQDVSSKLLKKSSELDRKRRLETLQLLLPEAEASAAARALVKPAPRRTSFPTKGTRDRDKRNEMLVAKLESLLSETRENVIAKQQALAELAREVSKMRAVFERVAKRAEDVEGKSKGRRRDSFTKVEEALADEDKMSYKDRVELLEKGPFNLVFHGVESDWMEEEMADDPEFKKDVLEQKIKKIIKDEAGLIREIPLLDVYRYEEGPRVRGVPPVVVSFKNRKDKEHVLWRSRDKLRKIGIMITEDSTARLVKLQQEQQEQEQQQQLFRPRQPPSPTKKKNMKSPARRKRLV